jgi:hypothetical protein
MAQRAQVRAGLSGVTLAVPKPPYYRSWQFSAKGFNWSAPRPMGSRGSILSPLMINNFFEQIFVFLGLSLEALLDNP